MPYYVQNKIQTLSMQTCLPVLPPISPSSHTMKASTKNSPFCKYSTVPSNLPVFEHVVASAWNALPFFSSLLFLLFKKKNSQLIHPLWYLDSHLPFKVQLKCPLTHEVFQIPPLPLSGPAGSKSPTGICIPCPGLVVSTEVGSNSVLSLTSYGMIG